jgi:hypothetical protein
MTVSEFLGYCARSIEAGIPVQGSLAPKGWGAYIGLTLPQDSDHASPEEVVSTRVLRFLLAQAIAKADEEEKAATWWEVVPVNFPPSKVMRKIARYEWAK